MGRQIQLTMLSEDEKELFAFVRSRCDLLVTPRYSGTAEIIELNSHDAGDTHLVLWNRGIQPTILRRSIDFNDGGVRYVIDDQTGIPQ